MPGRSFKHLVSFLPLSRWFSSVLRLFSVLYGSGTDAGWVRLYDAAAPAAISSAANPNNHTAKSRNDTTGSPLDSEHPALITTHGPRRRNREERAFARGLFVARSAFFYCTCSWCVCFSLLLSVGAWHYQGNQPSLRGLVWYPSLCFPDKPRLSKVLFGSILPDLSVPWSQHQPGPERR